MKFSPFASFPARYAIARRLLLVLVSGTICLSSCKDDVEHPDTSPLVSFTSEISSSWNSFPRSTTDAGAHTRSTTDADAEATADTPQSTVTVLQGGSTPLYLHTLYTDSIATPSSDGRPDTDMLTRSTPVTNTNMYNSFGVSAYSYTDSWSESKTPDFFYNLAASKSGGSYILPAEYRWPGASYKIKFFAYAPKGNGEYVLSGSTHAGSPTISVIIPGDVNKQKDLLVAKTSELNGNTNTDVPLTFRHALTAVRFECGDDMQGGTVRSVSLKNVYYKGTYNMETQTWSHTGRPATFAQALDKVTTGTAGEVLTTDAQTFMMIPQTLPADAQIEVVFTDKADNDHTLTANIQGKVWPMGKTVTYKISSTSINWTYTLTVPQPADFTYTGGTQQYSVTSYRQNNKGRKEPIAWTAQYSENNGASWTNNRPSWLTAFTLSGNGGATAQRYNATVSAQEGIDDSPHTAALRNATPRGTRSNPYNLSNQANGGPAIENTANCYVVDAPGHYSFPLVYGNGMTYGHDNPAAYNSEAPATPQILSRFLNHAGKKIYDPVIAYNADSAPDTPELIWQDAPGLIVDIQFEEKPVGIGSISFTVNRNTIQQGNAVIAIKDASGNILWSWHIWVTDEDISRTIEITNRDGRKYHIMPVNLGWCNGHTLSYAERSCKVRFTAGSLTREITIKQAAQTITTGNNNTYYQWGRKDPFPPSNGLADNANKVRYNKNGVPTAADSPTEEFPYGIDCIKNYILKPNVMQKKRFGDHQLWNLWSTYHFYPNEQKNDPVVKTIYDPCPYGFRLPDGQTFTGFTTTGVHVYNPAQINGIWDDSSKGWNLYTDSSKKKTIYFPIAGYRSYNGWIRGTGIFAFYWLASPNFIEYGTVMGLTPTQAGRFKDADRAFGYMVRPARE